VLACDVILNVTSADDLWLLFGTMYKLWELEGVARFSPQANRRIVPWQLVSVKDPA
jgi:hypothetical protein